ncbi:MAG: GerMN domain-containing protein, partial [Nitrospinota bacterium]
MEELRFELKKKRRKKRGTGTLLVVLLVLATIAGAGYQLLYREKSLLPPKPREEKAAPAPTGVEERATIQLYFATAEEDALIREPRTISVTGTLAEQMKGALLELIKGPTYGEAVETVPPGAKLRELYIDSQGRVYVDFSEELSTRHPGGAWSEILTVYSIVNTLAMNFSGISDVQILVEGREADSLAGHLDIRRPLKPDASL